LAQDYLCRGIGVQASEAREQPDFRIARIDIAHALKKSGRLQFEGALNGLVTVTE
jgi:hypothetical protein